MSAIPMREGELFVNAYFHLFHLTFSASVTDKRATPAILEPLILSLTCACVDGRMRHVSFVLRTGCFLRTEVSIAA